MAKNNWGNPIFDTVWQFFATFSLRQLLFLTFPACFSQSEYFFPIWITIVLIASTLINHYDRSNFLDMRHLQEQVKKAFCYQKLFWPFPQKIFKFSAFILEFQKFFLITKTIFFSHYRSEQFWKQNTISFCVCVQPE